MNFSFVLSLKWSSSALNFSGEVHSVSFSVGLNSSVRKIFFSMLIPSWRLFDHDYYVLARKMGSDEYMLSEYVYSHISVFIA